MVEQLLLGGIAPEQRLAQLAVDRLDRAGHAFAEVAPAVAVAQLDRLLGAGRGAGRHARAACPAGESAATSTSTVGIGPAVQDLAAADRDDLGVGHDRPPGQRNGIFAQPVERQQHVQEGWQLGERHHVGPVARGMVGIGMGLDEHRRHADRHGGAGQHRHELALAAAGAPRPPGCCTEWVASNTTGQPVWAICGSPRKSDTSVL